MFIIESVEQPKMYVMCWTEGNTVFLVEDPSRAETHKSIEEANRYIVRLRSAERFLSDKTEKSVEIKAKSFAVKQLNWSVFPAEKELENLTIQAYQVYGDSVDWKNYQGLPMPQFSELPEKIKNAWTAAIKAVTMVKS